MGGRDKACAVLGGRRLIDLALARLAPDADRVVISGSEDYGTGLAVIRDEEGEGQGPAAGVFALARWVASHAPAAEGFLTAPVDGPFFPRDLSARLRAAGGPAIAADDDGPHPTFAYWTLAAVDAARRSLAGESPPSLRRLAGACGAAEIRWPGKARFANINAPADLEHAANNPYKDD